MRGRLRSNTTVSQQLKVSAKGATWKEARANDMAAVDDLPPLIRRLLWENCTNLSADSVLRAYEQMFKNIGDARQASAVLAAKLRRLEMGEVETFAGEFLGQHRLAYPALAAQVSPVRYGPLGEAKFARSRR